MSEPSNYAEFWPYYLQQHSKPATRAWHYVGTSAGLALMLLALTTHHYLWLIGALLCGYAFAWISHGTIEKNKPATFKYPLWSFISDFRMLACFLSGRLSAELQRANVEV